MDDTDPVNILLVDDDRRNLLALEAVLSPLGENLVLALSGEEALKHSLATDFAAVLLDVRMPGMSGFQTARLLRSRARSRHTPIIFLTADEAELPVDEAYSLGAVDYLIKPVSANALTAKVAVFVELHRLRSAERERADKVAEESAAWLRTVTDSLPVLVGYIDRSHRYRFANRGYAEWFGLAPGDVIGKTVVEVLGPDIYEHRKPYLEAALRGEPVQFEGPTRHREKGIIETEITYTPHGAGADVPGMFVLIRDVTDRKRQEEAVRQGDARRKAVIETALDCVIGMDEGGRITEFNPAAEATFGYSRDEVLGHEMGPLIVPPEHQSGHSEGLARYLATGEARVLGRRIEMPALRKGGERFLCELSITRNPGDPPSFTGFLRDITERKQAEEELREAGRRKDEFLATLAHELRNPLAPIRTGLTVLRMGALDAEAEQVVPMMERQLVHLVRLVDDLLDVSRVTTGRVNLQIEPLDLREALQAALEATRPCAEEYGHGLDVRLPDKALLVRGDRTRLAQVFTNLLNNACKYTPRGGRVRVSAETDGREVVLIVADNGVGIPEDMLTKVFETFTQVGRSIERSQGGLGIGLALVRRLVEMHGGTVHAGSPGANLGSTFTVRLPAADLAPAGEAGRASVPLVALAPHRVLVVDDIASSANLLAMMLKGLGQDARTAYDGPSALKAVEELRPDVVISDIAMPGMDGYEVSRRIRAMRDGGPVLVALTGYGQAEDRRKAFEAGFDHHLVKPTSVDALHELLMKVPGADRAATR